MISRRVFGIGALAMTGDGLVRPVGAPRGQATPVGVQPGTSNVVVARFVIITGAGDGAFAYNGAPGPGNPPIAWLTGGGLVDPYGNVLPTVMGVEGNGIFSSTGGSGTTFIAGSEIAIVPAGGGSSAIFGAPSPGAAYMVSGTEPPTDSEAFLYLLSTLASGTYGAPVAVIANAFLEAQEPGATFPTPEVWHTISMDAGWSALAGHPTPAYKLRADGDVELVGFAQHANFAAATNFNSVTPLPASPFSYRPTSILYPRPGDANRCGVQVSPSGIITGEPIGGGSTQIELTGIIYPLGV